LLQTFVSMSIDAQLYVGLLELSNSWEVFPIVVAKCGYYQYNQRNCQYPMQKMNLYPRSFQIPLHQQRFVIRRIINDHMDRFHIRMFRFQLSEQADRRRTVDRFRPGFYRVFLMPR